MVCTVASLGTCTALLLTFRVGRRSSDVRRLTCPAPPPGDPLSTCAGGSTRLAQLLAHRAALGTDVPRDSDALDLTVQVGTDVEVQSRASAGLRRLTLRLDQAAAGSLGNNLACCQWALCRRQNGAGGAEIGHFLHLPTDPRSAYRYFVGPGTGGTKANLAGRSTTSRHSCLAPENATALTSGSLAHGRHRQTSATDAGVGK
jgi:hypothetical protein